tara:strand:- start:10044 stop:11393 length:1350 start_codon:yes stop_codon:yes gene_type:complete
MSEKLEKILDLVSEYIVDKKKNDKWDAGIDWLSYSGPHYDENEYVAAVKSLLDEWLVFGKDCRDFEIEFPKLLGLQRGVLTNSGSSANLLMVSALSSPTPALRKYHLPRGSKFITPVVCFPTTLNPLLQNGYEPVFVDVTLPDLNLDLDQVEKQLEQDPDIRGIIFAHVLGNPPDMDRLMSLVEKYNLIFLEDCCDALGSTYKGKKLGSFGVMSTCSFYPAHHMTMAEGGFIATNSYALYKTLASLRDWGRGCYCNEKKPGDVTTGTACGDRFKNWLCGRSDVIYDHRYVYNEVGYNLKPIELQGALGKQQIKKLPEMENARRLNFQKLYNIFKPYEKYFWLNSATPGSDPCWFGFLFTVKPDAPFNREQFVNFLETNKIQTRPYFAGNVLYHPAYKNLRQDENNIREKYPIADIVTLGSAFLGTYIGYTDEKMNYIKKNVDKFFQELK